MRADQVQVTWDSAKANWLVRIASGEEVVRRHLKAPRDADEQMLRSAALKTVQEDGYELESSKISIQR